MSIKGIKYNEDIMRPLCEEYANGTSMSIIANRENINRRTLNWWVRKLGFVTRGARIHTVNHTYFHNIDNQDKAYILGYTMADGSVSASATHQKYIVNRLAYNISSKDQCILEYIKQQMQCDYEITEYIPKGSYSNHSMSCLIINSTQLCTDLLKYGIIPNKVFKKMIPNINPLLLPHFIRGFYDGDGYSYKSYHSRNGKRYDSYTVYIGFSSASITILQQLREIFASIGCNPEATICFESNQNGRHKEGYRLLYCRKYDSVKIQKYMYHDANFFLQRKRIE